MRNLGLILLSSSPPVSSVSPQICVSNSPAVEIAGGVNVVVPISQPVVRMSSCSKDEVDAILIQCGRLSRSDFYHRFHIPSPAVVVVDPEAYAYDDEVIKKAEAMGKPGLIEIEARQESFIFTVETTGAIKASQLVLNAIEILKNKLDAVRLSEDTVEADDQFGELGAHMRGG